MSNALSLVYGDDRRLRAPWRIALFLVLVAAIYTLAIFAASEVFPSTLSYDDTLALSSYCTLLALLLAHFVALRWLERDRSWPFVGLGLEQANPKTLILGLALGACAIALPILALLATHELHILPAQPGSWWGATGRATLLLLPASLVEELLLRGYIFAVLRTTIGWKWTLIGTSIVFGLLHWHNPGATPESTMLVVLAGFFLGGILLATQSLYAAWMAHFAWNFTMAAAFHTAVSGLGLSTPNYTTVSSGPSWLTGGPWGPEGGFAAGLSMFAFIIVLFQKQFKHSHVNKTGMELVGVRKGVAEP